MDQHPQVVLAEIVVELIVVGTVNVHDEAREILHEVFVEVVGGDDLGFGRIGQCPDESDGRQKATRKLEHHRVRVKGEGKVEC